MRNLLRPASGRQREEGLRTRRLSPVLAAAGLTIFSGGLAGAQSTGDPTANGLELGPRCPTCPIVIPARPLSAKDKEDRERRHSEKNNFGAANAQRKLYIDDETNRMLILARDLKAKAEGLGSARPSSTMLREAEVIEFLARDIKEKMRLTVNLD